MLCEQIIVALNRWCTCGCYYFQYPDPVEFGYYVTVLGLVKACPMCTVSCFAGLCPFVHCWLPSLLQQGDSPDQVEIKSVPVLSMDGQVQWIIGEWVLVTKFGATGNKGWNLGTFRLEPASRSTHTCTHMTSQFTSIFWKGVENLVNCEVLFDTLILCVNDWLVGMLIGW